MRVVGVRRWGWLVAASVLVAAILGTCVVASAEELPTITGRVTSTGGVGIPGVSVRAVSSVMYMTDDYGATTTDQDGYYTLPVDTFGSVIVMFDPADSNVMNGTDYIGEFYNDMSYVLGATYVSSGASGIDAALAVGGSVSGTVYAPDGATQVTGVQVAARTGSAFDPKAVTVPGGTYVLRGVPAGSPSIAAVTAEYNTTHDTDFVDASLVAMVAPGVQATGVDITLGQGGRIAGVVTGAGAGLSDVDVSVRSTVGFMSPTFSGSTGPDGGYVVRGVPAGDSYSVFFSPTRRNTLFDTGYVFEYYQDARLASDCTLVVVAAGSATTGIDADLETGGSVSGTVYGPDGITPLAGIHVYDAYAGASDWTDGDGRYSLRGYNTGSTRVCFDPSEYNAIHGTAYLVEYYNDCPDLMSAAWIPVTIAEDTPGIDAVLGGSASTAGTITGVVYGPDSATPLAGVAVYASGPSYDMAFTQTDGSFEIAGLMPGEYWVFYDPMDYNIWADPDLQAQAYFGPVLVAAGATCSLEPVSLSAVVSAPITSIIVDPPLPGPSGWYGQAPVIALECSDPMATVWYYWGAYAPAVYAGPLTAPEGASTLTAYATDSWGNMGAPVFWDFRVDTTAPSAPLNVLAVPTAEYGIDLAWDPATDEGSGVDYYRVYVDGAYLGQTSGTTYQVAGLEPGTTYSFAVTAVDLTGHESAFSDAATATTVPAEEEPEGPPFGRGRSEGAPHGRSQGDGSIPWGRP